VEEEHKLWDIDEFVAVAIKNDFVMIKKKKRIINNDHKLMNDEWWRKGLCYLCVWKWNMVVINLFVSLFLVYRESLVKWQCIWTTTTRFIWKWREKKLKRERKEWQVFDWFGRVGEKMERCQMKNLCLEWRMKMCKKIRKWIRIPSIRVFFFLVKN
jgi:hypothetical protein